MTSTPSAAPLTCAEVIRLVTDYFEDALPPGDRERFEAHIGVCEGCSAYLSQMRATIQLTGRLSDDDIDEGAKAQLIEAFRGWKDAPPASPSVLEKLRQFFHR
jgi:anti-sigma factor RsiW